MNTHKRTLLSILVAATAGISAPIANSATIAADGGITLYLSYDDAESAGASSWNDMISQITDGCAFTNSARAFQGAPNSPGSCLSGNSCQGREKLEGDLTAFAEYVYEATEGQHYVRRVYLSDEGRAWDQADIKWSIGSGGSSSPQGWAIPFSGINMRNTLRTCIHDVLHHEFGHYFYNMPDRYASDTGYYRGRIGGGPSFLVEVDEGDPNSVMASNFPHRFVDTTNAQLTVSYNPGSGWVNNEVLTPALLADSDPNNDGPDRAHHGHSMPFAQDEWSVLPSRHADLAGVHTEGNFVTPNLANMPAPELIFLGEDEPHPGTVLLLDRSGSMGVTTNGVTAAQFVQEAGMFLYHSSLPTDFVGTQLYNASVENLFDYQEYDPSNNLPAASFRSASGATNIAAALESAIDALIAEHGDEGAHGGKIVLMSDGVQTTGPNLWDQVTRAEEKGIAIHTLSFGNADIPTMEAIATNTGGDVIAMSERTDGSELKLGMARELSELRGMTPIHFQKEVLLANGDNAQGAFYEGTFNLPKFSRALQFYSFLEMGNAAEHPLELIDPDGNSYTANPQNVAHKGRLNGINVLQPKAGKWHFRIGGSKRLKGGLPTGDAFELIAYTQDRNLDASVSVYPSLHKPGHFIIEGQPTHKYPLMNTKAVANIYKGRFLLATVPLLDNGKTNVDQTADDGIYSALFNPEILDNFEQVRVDVAFTTTKDSLPAKYAHYEAGTDVKALMEQYEKRLKTEFTAYATDTVSFADKSKYDPTIVSIRPDIPQATAPGKGNKLTVLVDNAYLDKSTLRAALGQGVKVEVLAVKQDEKAFRSTVTLAYEVQEQAYNGPRTLILQANQLHLEAPHVLDVDGGAPYGPVAGDIRIDVIKTEPTVTPVNSWSQKLNTVFRTMLK